MKAVCGGVCLSLEGNKSPKAVGQYDRIQEQVPYQGSGPEEIPGLLLLIQALREHGQVLFAEGPARQRFYQRRRNAFCTVQRSKPAADDSGMRVGVSSGSDGCVDSVQIAIAMMQKAPC